MTINNYVNVHDLAHHAARLLSEDGENPEYDRAIAELMCEAYGLPLTDNKDDVLAQLRVIRKLLTS